MEKTISGIKADIAADIASLRANAAKYRKLAEHRGDAGHAMVAEELMKLVADLEAKLEAYARSRGLDF